jgi:hypothetical protein
MNVEQLMMRDVAPCTASDTLIRAALLMWEFDCGCIPSSAPMVMTGSLE